MLCLTEIQTFLSLTGDEVEENWTNHVTLLMTSSAADNVAESEDIGRGVTLVNMYTLFGRLFKVCFLKLTLNVVTYCPVSGAGK